MGTCAGLEREIDRLVYQLYELTNDEIAIVEGQTAGMKAEGSRMKEDSNE